MSDEPRKCDLCGQTLVQGMLCQRCDAPCHRCNHTRRVHKVAAEGVEVCPTSTFQPYPKKG